MDVEKEKRIQRNYHKMRTIINDLKIENMEFPPDELAMLEKIAREEMTTDEMWEKTVAEIEQLKKTHPEKFFKGELK